MYIYIHGNGGGAPPLPGLGALTHLVALRVLRYTLNPENNHTLNLQKVSEPSNLNLRP